MAKRKKGNGTIRKRNDGRWEGRLVVGYKENGNPITKDVLAKTKSLCAEKLKALKASLQEPTPTPTTKKSDISFGKWLEFWYETYSKPTLRPNTQSGYESAITLHILPEIGQVPLSQLTTNHLQQFYNDLKTSGRKRMSEHYGEGLSNRTVRLVHIICRMALDRAVSDDLLHTNPANGCKLPPKQTKEMQVLTREEMQRFFIQAKEEGYYELFLLELATGLRRGEILALQWDDLNFATGELKISKQVTRTDGKLTVSQPKTKAGNRTIILPQAVLEMMVEYHKNSQSDWLFPSPVIENSPLDPAAVRKKLQQILEHADCKKVRFHDLRHTFATMALAGGMDIKTLSTVIGHVSTSTTLDVYTHSTEEMQRQAAQRIDVGMGNKTPPQLSPKSEPTQGAKFEPYKGKIRKPGTGCVSQINEQLWQGRYTPTWVDGKRRPLNIYGKTELECEDKLATLITETKAELAALKAVQSAQNLRR